MWRTSALALAIITWGTIVADHQAQAAPKRRGAMIVSPKRNTEVERSHEVIGKLHVPGQPVILVKPVEGNGTWWIQPKPSVSERGYFKTEVRFGSETSRRGDRFSLVILVLQSSSDIEYLRDRDSISKLPTDIWQSEEVPVVLGDSVKEDKLPVVISAAVLKPQQDEKVKRVTELIGRVPEQLRPVILIRVDDSGGLWWVQDPVAMGKGGYFKSTVRFGNDKTPDGTKFRVVVVTPRSGREAAVLKTGNSLADLPNGIPRSKEVTVQLDRPDTQRVEGAE
ncbi:MAG: hypothetical protein H8E66_06690 [Planctomycetes bacterium]|nr:hypothetical protein [Planctomycetota bacterium]